MLKKIAIAFGLIMIIVGLLGFTQIAAPNGYLLGIFHVNGEHNLIHIVTGIISLICGLASGFAARLFFRTFGIVYGLVAVLGLYYVDQPILGLIANNVADIVLHAIIAVFALYVGFSGNRQLD